MTHKFDPTILREYDIRGVVGETVGPADAYALGRTFAALAHGMAVAVQPMNLLYALGLGGFALIWSSRGATKR